ncbi:MAG: tetratricopeptide repeat protein [bacterium]
MAEEDPDEPSEGESEESSPPEEESPTPEELAEEVLDEESETEEPEQEGTPADAGEEELSPEELAEEVLEEEDVAEEETEPPGEQTPESPEGSEPEGSVDEESEESDVVEEPPEEASEEEPTEEDLSPEELAEEVLQEEDLSEEDLEEVEEPPVESSEEPELEESAEAEQAEEGAAEEPAEEPSEEEPGEEELSPEELAEEVIDEEDLSEEGLEEGEEPGPEESTEAEVAEEGATEESAGEPREEETGEEELSPEDLAEEAIQEEEDIPEETESEEAESDVESPDVETGTTETESPAEEPSEPESTEDSEESSIQDMLEQEAKRTREAEEEPEEEEELPEGYMTVDQLPEQEEFTVPPWVKTSGWVLLWLGTVGLVIWYLAMPLWETYLMNQIKNSMDRNNYEEARSWADTGLFLNGAFIKYDDRFLADYLKQLLDKKQFERYEQAYQALTTGRKAPEIQKTHTEYLLNRGQWKQAQEKALQLQRWVETRGFGYLFHAKASLELGELDLAQSDLNQASNWIKDHPASRRILRDIYYKQKNYEEALGISNELRGMTESDPWSMKVEDFVRLAQIHKNLEQRGVAQQMLERALQKDPTNKGALEELARQYLRQERWERAQPLVMGTEYREGYRSLYPFDSFGWWASAELSLANENISKSIRTIERGHDLNPRDPEVHRIKGTLYLDHLSQPGEAVDSYEKAHHFGLRRLTFYNKLGEAYYQSSNFMKAAETFELIKSELGDTQPAVNYSLGSAYLGAGEFDRARKHIKLAFNQGFRNQFIYNQWGLLLELEGKIQEALSKYYEGIEWGQSNNEPTRLLQRNLDRAFSKENPSPLSEWLAPLSQQYEIPTWKTVPGSRAPPE